MTIKDYRWNSTARGWALYANKDEKMARWLEDAERAYNASSGMMSTCEFRMPPGVRLEGRSCREAPAGP